MAVEVGDDAATVGRVVGSGRNRYRPLRAVLLWHALVALVMVFVLVDLPTLQVAWTPQEGPGVSTGITDPVTEDAGSAVVPAADDAGSEDWFAAFVSRSTNDPFRLAMFWSFGAVMLYGLLQLLALPFDVAQRAGSRGVVAAIVGGILAVLSGRSPGFYGRPLPRWHFEEGLHILLLPLRQGTPLFPAVGFMGTVIGISIAIQQLPTVKDDDNLKPLLDGLYVAFDTTLLGLIALTLLTVVQILIENQRLAIVARIAGAHDG